MSIFRSVPALALLLVSTTSCKQYYTIDTACDDGFPGKGLVSPKAFDAFIRVNCYRRLENVTKASANKLAAEAADAAMDYILANPDPTLLLGSEGVGGYLRQRDGDAAYTGVDVRQRLEHADYIFFDASGTEVAEAIAIQYRPTLDEPEYTIERAIDEMMRVPGHRQRMLQPSLIDAAFGQVELDKEWLTTAGATAEAATVYYWMTIYTAPHIEHVDRPLLLPRDEQTDVPLYRKSVDVTDPYYPVPTVISWPVTFLVGSLDKAAYRAIDQNPYEVVINAQSIENTVTNEVLETHVVAPGDDPTLVWPEGNSQRWVIAIYAKDPFEPLTRYHLTADMSTVDGDFEFDYFFKTAAEDPGYESPDPEPSSPEARAAFPGGLFQVASEVTVVEPELLPAGPSSAP